MASHKRMDAYIHKIRLRIMGNNLEEDKVLLSIIEEYRAEIPSDRPIVLAAALQRRRQLEKKYGEAETPELKGVRLACKVVKAWDSEVRTESEVAADINRQITKIHSRPPTKRGKRETVFGSSRNRNPLKPFTSKPS